MDLWFFISCRQRFVLESPKWTFGFAFRAAEGVFWSPQNGPLVLHFVPPEACFGVPKIDLWFVISCCRRFVLDSPKWTLGVRQGLGKG